MAAVIVPSSSPPHRLVDARRPEAGPELRLLPGGRAGAPPARVYLRRRVAVALASCTVVVILWLAVTGAAALLRGPVVATPNDAVPVAGAPLDSASSYVVQPGDTLWTIARGLDPEGDIRALVDELAERAGGASLDAGQRIDLRGLRD
jgi:hypothetical protein